MSIDNPKLPEETKNIEKPAKEYPQGKVMPKKPEENKLSDDEKVEIERNIDKKIDSDSPLSFTETREFLKLERQNNWPGEKELEEYMQKAPQEVIGQIMENRPQIESSGGNTDELIKNYEQFKGFDKFEIKSLSQITHWHELTPYFEKNGIKGIEDAKAIIIDDEKYWENFYGSNDSKSGSEHKTIILKKSIFEAPDISEEYLSHIVHEAGHIIFYDRLDDKTPQYMDKYHKEQEYTSSAMESIAFQTQFDYLKSVGKTKAECLGVVKNYIEKSFGNDDRLDDTQKLRKQVELRQLMDYVNNVYDIDQPPIENQKKTENQEKEVVFISYFPAKIENAEEKKSKYEEVYNRNEIFKKATENNKNQKILYNIVGLMPEVGFYWGAGFEELETPEEREELKKIYEKEFGLKLVKWSHGGYSIINPESVKRVIENCPIPDLFPEEAKSDPVNWAISNPDMWGDPSNADQESKKGKIQNARFGILSGYPPHSSAVFQEYWLAHDKFNKMLTDEEIEMNENYIRSDRNERKFPVELQIKLKEAVDKRLITTNQADLIQKHFRYKELENFGDGFFDEDEKYFQNLKVYEEKTKINLDYWKYIGMQT